MTTLPLTEPVTVALPSLPRAALDEMYHFLQYLQFKYNVDLEQSIEEAPEQDTNLEYPDYGMSFLFDATADKKLISPPSQWEFLSMRMIVFIGRSKIVNI